MNITIVNGTNRENSKTLGVTNTLNNIAVKLNHQSKIVTLDNFKALFTGEYTNLDNSTLKQKTDIQNIINAKIVIFVIPTYHHGVPGSLKNFFDIIDYKSTNLYEKKIVGLVAANTGVDAIRQARTIINEIFAYYNFTSIIPPKDLTIDLYTAIDEKRLAEYLNYLVTFANAFNP